MDENPYVSPGSDDLGEVAARKTSPISKVLKSLLAVGIVGIVICLMLPTVRHAGPAARRNACVNNMRQIALALRNYADKYQALPPAYTTDVDGRPLHSWRTLILPFLGQSQLYRSIDLTKPWDDPANAKAFKTIVHEYRCPSALDGDDLTTYLAIVTSNSCFRPTEARSLSDITDRASETMTVIEVDSEHAVPWMSPIDADEKVVMGIGPKSELTHGSGMYAAFLDGSVHFLDAETPASQRRALISIAGNDKAAEVDAD